MRRECGVRINHGVVGRMLDGFDEVLFANSLSFRVSNKPAKKISRVRDSFPVQLFPGFLLNFYLAEIERK